MKSIIAIIIVLVIVLGAGAAYYYSAHRALAPTTSTSTPTATVTTTTTTTTSNPYTDISTWQTNTESQAGFSIAHPASFSLSENKSSTPTTDWRLNSTDPGVKVLTITVPQSFESKTNFADATLTVGYSKNAKAVASCLTPDPSGGPAVPTSTAMINGINFTVFTMSDAGAGNIYKSMSYRTLHAGSCYAVEYTVHSSQLANFPASYGLTQYSDATIDQVLNLMVGTFKFL